MKIMLRNIKSCHIPIRFFFFLNFLSCVQCVLIAYCVLWNRLNKASNANCEINEKKKPVQSLGSIKQNNEK